MKQNLIPRDPKRMRQPRKDVLREQLALAADEIIRLRSMPMDQSASKPKPYRLFDTACGASRFVVLCWRWAVKFPRIDRSESSSPLQRFAQGVRCNLAERRQWAARANPMLCPIVFSDPLGLVVVMPRARSMSDDEFDAWWSSDDWARHDGPQIFEDSAKDAGVLPNGRRVMVDYGVEGYS